MSGAFVILCNDEPKHVIIGSRKFADEFMMKLVTKAHSIASGFRMSIEEYDDGHKWHIEECPYSLDNFNKRLP